MNNVLSFYFDGTIVQAVKVRVAGNSVTVMDARTFNFDEMDDYLALCREKTCIVCSNPPFFYQDIIHLPPAAHKYHDKLVRTEIKNAHPDLASFCIVHRTIGESTIDTRRYSKIAAFSYPDDFLSDFIPAANRHGIAISHVYAAPFSIFRLALSTCDTDPDQSRIFIATLPGEKLLLVSENSELEFIRKIPSLDSALFPEDTNNINMTVDYCFQSLRARPIEVVMLNQPELSGDFSHRVSVPCRSLLPPQLEDIPPHIIHDYFAPITAALHAIESPRIGNILPSDYRIFSTHKKLLTAAAIFMSVVTLFLAAYLVTEWMIISGLKSNIARIRTELSGSADEIATFRKLDAEANAFKQPLDFINTHNSSPNPATALAALILPESGEYTINGVTVQNEESFLSVKIEGAINASGYSETQASFEKLISQLTKIPGYAVSSSSVDIKQKHFSILARYNGGGPERR